MTKKQKIWLGNFSVLFFTYLFPLFIFNKYQNKINDTNFVKYSVFFILLCGSIFLLYFNIKNYNKEKINKSLYIFFGLFGVLGFLYSISILFLLFSFRHGIGF